MKSGEWKRWVIVSAVVVAGAAGVFALVRYTSLGRAETWERQASPGDLSSAHAFLADNCAACHTPMKGVTADKCIACHATSQVLQREPTAFHATVGTCRECHAEHRGAATRPTVMDHAALAAIGMGKSAGSGAGGVDDETRSRLRRLLAEGDAGPHPGITREEAVLNCATCHGTKDRHQSLFGKDCAQCHGTTKWTIPEFRHPSPQSTNCAQCHQAPPSHYMGHFHMVSKKVAGQPHADVRQCFICHQTTAWNDIKGVGWYKHH
jgi:hypothetical protein